MVSLLVQPRSMTVTSVAVAPGAPPQLLSPRDSWLAAVTRGEEVVYLSHIPDPFAQRGLADRRDRSQPHDPCTEGRAVVAVPFRSVEDLTQSLLHVLDLGSHRLGADRQSLRDEVGRRLERADTVRTVDFAAVRAAPQWASVGELLGLGPRPRR
jgi:hypothetical protein